MCGGTMTIITPPCLAEFDGERCGHDADCACHICPIGPNRWCGERDCHRYQPTKEDTP